MLLKATPVLHSQANVSLVITPNSGKLKQSSSQMPCLFNVIHHHLPASTHACTHTNSHTDGQ